MLSRVADSIYWMNRYIERAENVSRFIDVNLHLMLDMPSGADEQWDPLLYSTGDYLSFQERVGRATRDSVVKFLTFDKDNPNSIFSCLREARENARTVREIITAEMWEQINTFYLAARSAANLGTVPGEPHEFFTGIKMASHLYEGITDATMAHGEGWHFGRLGRPSPRRHVFLLAPRCQRRGWSHRRRSLVRAPEIGQRIRDVSSTFRSHRAGARRRVPDS